MAKVEPLTGADTEDREPEIHGVSKSLCLVRKQKEMDGIWIWLNGIQNLWHAPSPFEEPNCANQIAVGRKELTLHTSLSAEECWSQMLWKRMPICREAWPEYCFSIGRIPQYSSMYQVCMIDYNWQAPHTGDARIWAPIEGTVAQGFTQLGRVLWGALHQTRRQLIDSCQMP